MSLTQNRNPFKKSASKPVKTVKNPLSHLTEKFLGFRGNLSGCEPIESNKDSEDIENVEVNTNCEVDVSLIILFI